MKHFVELEPIAGETKYIDYDEITGTWGVFGADSGVAYGSYVSEEDAERSLKEETVLTG